MHNGTRPTHQGLCDGKELSQTLSSWTETTAKNFWSLKLNAFNTCPLMSYGLNPTWTFTYVGLCFCPDNLISFSNDDFLELIAFPIYI